MMIASSDNKDNGWGRCQICHCINLFGDIRHSVPMTGRIHAKVIQLEKKEGYFLTHHSALEKKCYYLVTLQGWAPNPMWLVPSECNGSSSRIHHLRFARWSGKLGQIRHRIERYTGIQIGICHLQGGWPDGLSRPTFNLAGIQATVRKCQI